MYYVHVLKMLVIKMLSLCAVGFIFLVAADIANAGDASPVFPESLRGGQRIVSGWEASKGQFPYQLSIRMVNGEGTVTACGGTIIHNKWGLTSAHCTAQRKTLIIRAGASNLTQPDAIFETSTFYTHPDYVEELLHLVQPDDIALIDFGRYIYSDNIRPIKLQSSLDKDKDYSGVRMMATGWGATSTGGFSSEVLNWVYLEGVSFYDCYAAYGFSSVVGDTTICAGPYNVTSQSVCSGDSGGPLVVSEDGELIQVGVTSFVSGWGCESPEPSGFVRPGYYHGWIYEVTGLNLDYVPGEGSSDSNESVQVVSSEESSDSSESVQVVSSEESSDSSESVQVVSSEESSDSSESVQVVSSEESSDSSESVQVVSSEESSDSSESVQVVSSEESESVQVVSSEESSDSSESVQVVSSEESLQSSASGSSESVQVVSSEESLDSSESVQVVSSEESLQSSASGSSESVQVVSSEESSDSSESVQVVSSEESLQSSASGSSESVQVVSSEESSDSSESVQVVSSEESLESSASGSSESVQVVSSEESSDSSESVQVVSSEESVNSRESRQMTESLESETNDKEVAGNTVSNEYQNIKYGDDNNTGNQVNLLYNDDDKDSSPKIFSFLRWRA